MYNNKLIIDWTTIILWLAISIFGWMNIYAACYNEAHTTVFDFSIQYGKQIIWIVVAIFLAIIIMFTEPQMFSNFAYVVYAFVLVLLVVTLAIATATHGAVSWINFGFFKLQPSEFAKFATALALSKYMTDFNRHYKQRKTQVVTTLLILIPAGLILLQHDTGSALVFFGFIIPLYREGLSPSILVVGVAAIVLFVLSLLIDKFILISIIVAIALIYLFVWLSKRTRRHYMRTIMIVVMSAAFIFSVDFLFNHVLESHQRERIEVLLGKNTDTLGSGYNVHQSKIAIGSGGLFGRGYLNGTLTKADFVPEQHTDFIFCTVGEEWGFVFSSLLIAAYIYLLIHLVNMAERQRSTFSRFYGYSVAGILFMHLFINVGMVLGLVPVIGIPLPFFSYGGSSMISFTILLFIFVRLDASRTQLIN